MAAAPAEPSTDPSPLRPLLEQAGAGFMTYGPMHPPDAATPAQPTIELVDTFGEYEAEYAAIRKGVALLTMPQRGMIEVTGADRAAFLHRLLTHDISGLTPGQGRRAFLLGKTGRIVADLLVLHETDRTVLTLDATDLATTAQELDKYLFTEDARIRDTTANSIHLALHGPAAPDLIAALTAQSTFDLPPLEHRDITLAATPCQIFRHDETAAPGLHLIVPFAHATTVYQALLAAMQQPPLHDRARSIGWLAYNTARVEAGTPIFHIDFGPDTLPHETALLDAAVSFTKGCYVGQEVVARMQNLGHPKRILTGLALEDHRLPSAGTPIYDATPTDDKTADQPPAIGAVTSSAVSPLRSGRAIAIAMMKWTRHTPGTEALVPAEGARFRARVEPLNSLMQANRP